MMWGREMAVYDEPLGEEPMREEPPEGSMQEAIDRLDRAKARLVLSLGEAYGVVKALRWLADKLRRSRDE